MKNKFKYLIKYSLKKKLDTKWFKIVNILLCLLLIFIMNMDYFINLFGGDFNNTEKIYVVDKANTFDAFKEYFLNFAENLDYGDAEIILDNGITYDKDNIDDKIVVVIENDFEEYLKAEIISYDTVSRNVYEIVKNSLNAIKQDIVLNASGLSPSDIAKFTSPVNFKETVLNLNAKDNETKESISGVITTVIIVPFFILIVSMVQMLGAEINDEKTSRGMEIIISSVPAKMHFLSKVISSICFVLLQGILLISYGIIGLLYWNS